MNILYIIGNGLDIAHHMKTAYQDFFKYYLKVASDDNDIWWKLIGRRMQL